MMGKAVSVGFPGLEQGAMKQSKNGVDEGLEVFTTLILFSFSEVVN